ncbi:hypothetical protein BDY21DRAFT_424169 [Lineolata rhizophorae]|uniref:Zn(2)-C6 fungal-type domain-containing protein n=1 Tax=Lineolata rhizophorae TaxID=578093 RepID=A0A6A6NPS1_9PEZI|nr:hypothetical protein BDY21DRAFT_424169 [Lineolata rhizophorae]
MADAASLDDAVGPGGGRRATSTASASASASVSVEGVARSESPSAMPPVAAAEQQRKPAGAQKANAKDPLRPRRKKARRACFACQRAHLTCGDERPCKRCIKRGLQDQCQDGVRKKAKYLHDAPPEALMPGMGGAFMNHLHHHQQSPNGQSHHGNGAGLNGAAQAQQQQHMQGPGTPGSVANMHYFGQNQPGPFNIYPQTPTQTSMGPPPPPQPPHSLSDSAAAGILSGSFGSQASPLSPPQASPGLPPPPPGSSGPGGPAASQAALPFNPADPAIFNLDITSLNFDNHYGALEFGMLGQMAGQAGETPPGDASGVAPGHLAGQFGAGGAGYADGHMSGIMFGPDPAAGAADWQTHSRQGSTAQQGGQMHTPQGTAMDMGGGGGFTIGAGPASLASASPGSATQDLYEGLFGGQPGQGGGQLYGSPGPQHQPHPQQHTPVQQHQRLPSTQQPPPPPPPPRTPSSATQKPGPQWGSREGKSQTLAALQAQSRASHKRRRETTEIYENVKQPYSYTAGFHSLLRMLQRRFDRAKTLRIARALSAIRPSFLACTRTLNRSDLVFMEQGFQRSLWEHEEYINATSTPTLICRRTGEIATANIEFSILTGWKKDVLTGKERNLNVNTGHDGYYASSGGSDAPWPAGIADMTSDSHASAAVTPAPGQPGGGAPGGGSQQQSQQQQRSQPVFLAELLDDDSVIRFYEDFASLAFSDSRGVAQHPCRLLKYRTQQDVEALGQQQQQQQQRRRTAVEVQDRGGVGEDEKGGVRGPPNGEGMAGGAGANGAANGGGRRASGAGRSAKKGVGSGASGSSSAGGGGVAAAGMGSGGPVAAGAVAGETAAVPNNIDSLGEGTGKVDCMCIWTVKRDIFEVPMMIVINFLPVLDPVQPARS